MKDITLENDQRRMEIVDELLPKATPFHGTWRRVVALAGLSLSDIDYQDSDAGEYYRVNE